MNQDEALVKRAMIEGAAQVVAVAAADKLGTAGAFAVAPVTRVSHLVTDRSAGDERLAPSGRRGWK